MYTSITHCIPSNFRHFSTSNLQSSNEFWMSLFESHLTEHFHFAESVWKLLERLFLGTDRSPSRRVARNVVFYSSKNKHITTGRRLVQFGTVTYRSSSRALESKVMHILSYRRSIVKLLGGTYTFEKVRGSLFKYIEKRKRRCFFVSKLNQQVARVKRWIIK